MRGPSPNPSPLESAVRLLAGRDYTAAELEGRLERAGIDPQDRRAVLERLAADGYLDDDRVAHERAARLAERGYGDAAIRADLERRGVDAPLVKDALGALQPEAERAMGLFVKLGRGARAVRALARKGFSEASIEAALDGVAQDP